MEKSTQCDHSMNSSELLPAYLLKPEQEQAIDALYEGNHLLVAGLGFGKTVIAATAIAELLDNRELTRVLIVTTPKICETVWRQEMAKWQQTNHIQIAAANGTPQERIDVIRRAKNKVVVITFNVLKWMKDHSLFDHFDGLLIDETSKLTSTGGVGFKSLRNQLKKFKWRCGLTGTPVSENLQSLFAQVMLIDCGRALGTNSDKFLRQYFYPTDFNEYNWAIRPGSEGDLMQKVAHIIYVAPEYTHELPPITYKTVYIPMPDKLSNYYKTMKKDMVTEDAISQTAAVLSQKLQQIACGFIYREDSDPLRLSEFRMDALKKLTIKHKRESLIICYWYKESLEQLKELLPDAVVFDSKNPGSQVKQWNEGKIRHLLIHPRSAGHGIQLQAGGHTMIWLCPYWSRDLWEQTNARIWRRGQTKPVTIYTIEAEGSIDQLISQRVEDKAQFAKLFKQHLNN